MLGGGNDICLGEGLVRTMAADVNIPHKIPKHLSNKPPLWRLGVAMAAIITLSFIGMLSSVFTAEIIRGDASAINQAGSLRMQSYRIVSVLALAQNGSKGHIADAQAIQSELRAFDNRLASPRLVDALPDSNEHELSRTYRLLDQRWANEVRPVFAAYSDPLQLDALSKDYAQRLAIQRQYLQMVNGFVAGIDKFVALLEEHAESKIQHLKLVLGASLTLTLAAVLFTMYLFASKVLVPLGQLLECASHARLGDLSVRTSYTADDEMGQLGSAFNLMAEDLSKMYANLEERVNEKTVDLERSNRSLGVLYNTIKHLSEAPLSDATYEELLKDLEEPLGLGPGAICLAQNTLTSQHVLASTRLEIDEAPDVCLQKNCEECYADGLTHTFSAHCTDNRDVELVSTSIMDQDTQVGIIFMEIPPGTKLDDWQVQILEMVARHISMALNITQRVTETRRLALLEERSVIARELHDSLAQSLSYLKIQATRLDMTLLKPGKEDEAQSIISEMREGISTAYRQLRELLTTFRLRMDGRGLNNALKETVEELRQRSGIKISLENHLGECQLNAHQEVHVLQVVREVLTNAVSHSKAENIQVALLYDSNEHRIAITVDDDGIGIADHEQRRNHYGLAIINERAERLGGEIRISNREGGGTRVTLEFSPATRNFIDFTQMMSQEVALDTSVNNHDIKQVESENEC